MKQSIARMLGSTLAAVLLMIPGGVSYANEATTVCPPDGCRTVSTGTLFGQNQAYDVLLRGNGEAIVNTRITLTNSNPDSLKNLSYTTAVGHLGDVTAFQQISCSDLPPLKAANPTPTSAPGNAPAMATPRDYAISTTIPECYPIYTDQLMGVSVPQENATAKSAYIPPFYYPSGFIYQRATVTKSGNSFSLNLPQEVKANKSATIVMLYTARDVATKKRGVFHYTFKTLQSESPVSSATVAVSVDDNYFLADAAKTNVDYRPVTSESSLNASLSAAPDTEAGAKASFYVSNIGQNGGTIKRAYSMASKESFTVTGRYADSVFMLNWQRTILKWAIALGIFAILTAAYMRWRKHRKQPRSNTSKEKPAAHARQTPFTKTLPFHTTFAQIIRYLHEHRIRPLFFAWLCGIGLLILVGAIISLASYLSNLSLYGSAFNANFFRPLTLMSLVLCGGLGFLLLGVAAPITYAGSFKQALRIYVHMLVFFAVVSIAFVLIASRLDSSQGGGGCFYPASSSGTSSLLLRSAEDPACPM